LKLLDINRGIYKTLIPRVVEQHRTPSSLWLPNPPDPLADIARDLARHDRVLSTGTYLDSLRFACTSASGLV